MSAKSKFVLAAIVLFLLASNATALRPIPRSVRIKKVRSVKSIVFKLLLWLELCPASQWKIHRAYNTEILNLQWKDYQRSIKIDIRAIEQDAIDSMDMEASQ